MNETSDEDNPHDETLPDLMRRAEAGDRFAALEVVKILAFVVGLSNTCREPHSSDPTARILMPVPVYVRQYLSRALELIGTGTDSRDALFLRAKRGPRPFWTYREKKLAVDLMQQLVGQEQAIDSAAATAAGLINQRSKALVAENPNSPWKKFAQRSIDATTLLSWYYDERSPSRR